ncbi:MAG TPA: membrane-bound PQQ-dependent dehydrogenase, glucose/quinate/shikimate family [Sphingobium sp.]|nr:membrane-bound PQQ-dependent dehydrogenase, glucose/quinate/shikimate family [Sphingobium sp.]
MLGATTDRNPGRAVRAYTAFLLLIALGLAVGGGWLLILGGSPYYLLAGLALAASALLLWRGRREAVWLYAALFIATVAWSIWEAGFEPWALMPRLVAWTMVGAVMALPAFRRRLLLPKLEGRYVRQFCSGRGFFIALAGAIMLGGLANAVTPKPADPRFQRGVGPFPAMRSAPELSDDAGEWREWGRDKGGSRFSPLTQINPGNVGQLELAWTAPIATSKEAESAGAEATPLMVGGTLYTCNGKNEVFAIDLETGKRLWNASTAGTSGHTCRGVVHYRQQGASGLCAERILTATGAATLVALDARTGRRCQGFGKAGSVNLLEGMPSAPAGYYYVTSAPALVRGKLVFGGWVTDGQYWGEPSGVIRAYDAVSGKLAWAWDMGAPERIGAPPPGQTYTHSTPNNWAPLSADEELGMVYVPLGNPAVDYFGGLRRPFDEKYGSSVVALDAETGRPHWSFQTTHHDVWDYDVASQPVLADIPRPDGVVEKALVQGTKRGEIFVLDRRTGKPLRRVEERPVPQRGKVPEERLSPTQPFSVGMASFGNPELRESDMWGITPLDQLACRIAFRRARYQGTMTPPGLTPWITSPGTTGGMNWGSYSIDQDHKVMVVTTGRIVHLSRLLPRSEAEAKGMRPLSDLADHAGGGPQMGAPYAAEVGFFLSPLFSPCQAPPYGYISAVDLVTGKLIWSRPIGTARDSGPLGLATGVPLPLGTFMIGGAITTRSGLIFVAATADRTIRALDIRTGRQLWQSYLPHGGFSTPMTAISPKSGRQFVVVSSASLYGLGRPDGAKLIAFALPRKQAR